MLPMLGIVRMLLPDDEKLGVRNGSGSSRSSPGVPGDSRCCSSKSEKGEWDMPKKCGVVGDGVAVVVVDEPPPPAVGFSLKKASRRRCSSAVAVGERKVGRLMRL